MDNVEDLGTKAYQKGLWGDYEGAVAILSEAIAQHPLDKRLYNDRSFYHCKLENYVDALRDAESLLKLCPNYKRAYVRKADVLMELKRYEEAESVYRELLRLDPDSEDAQCYLLQAQICELTKDNKHWVQDARRALQVNLYNTKQARSFLELENGKTLNNNDNSDVYYSDEEVEGPRRKRKNRLGSGDRLSDYDPFTDPSNPYQSNALWVGNVTTRVDEHNLRPVFSKYGEIKSIFVHHKNGCAFVNYAHPNMASNAMRHFPKYLQLEDTNLVIRFPEGAKSRHALSCGLKPVKNK